MRRSIVHLPREDWRERLFWSSLACALIALMLLGLVALAEWGERADATPIAGVATAPGTTGLMADLLIPPPAPPALFAEPLPQLPTVDAAPRADPDPRPDCSDVAGAVAVRPVPLFADGSELCP